MPRDEVVGKSKVCALFEGLVLLALGGEAGWPRSEGKVEEAEGMFERGLDDRVEWAKRSELSMLGKDEEFTLLVPLPDATGCDWLCQPA